ncbi:hypothetical protein ILUMI_14149 [Ignelater luminosus]|uniref:DDE Tnp4 domain-containing protein n=1 Tax=Ignelater luminosus TaxID=2038154 RepID=A0A8K0CT19_IGNLU|nr:hypothetical protein ILUMI_14149 [Ignelater luminosus]
MLEKQLMITLWCLSNLECFRSVADRFEISIPGSLHDAKLFTFSDLYLRINDNDVAFPNNSHLIGDLAYPLSTKLLVGFKNTGDLTEHQENCNHKLSQTRVVIEHAFAYLKGRFRRLKFLETEDMPDDIVNLQEELLAEVDLDGFVEPQTDFHNNQAVTKRNGIVNI